MVLFPGSRGGAGAAVAITDDGRTVLVAANGDTTQETPEGLPKVAAGAAYLFGFDARRYTWKQRAKLVASDGDSARPALTLLILAVGPRLVP